MNWSDLEKTWTAQTVPPAGAPDIAQLRKTFEDQSRRLARSLFWRNLREAGAGLLLAVSIAYSALHMATLAWLYWLSVALVLAVTAFFIREMVRARRGRLGAETPLLTKLDADIAELSYQRRLLLSVRGWYLAPLFASMCVRKLARMLSDRTLESLLHDPRALAGLVFYLLFMGSIFWGVWIYNRRAVRKKIEPQLQALETLRHDLLSSS